MWTTTYKGSMHFTYKHKMIRLMQRYVPDTGNVTWFRRFSQLFSPEPEWVPHAYQSRQLREKLRKKQNRVRASQPENRKKEDRKKAIINGVTVMFPYAKSPRIMNTLSNSNSTNFVNDNVRSDLHRELRVEYDELMSMAIDYRRCLLPANSKKMAYGRVGQVDGYDELFRENLSVREIMNNVRLFMHTIHKVDSTVSWKQIQATEQLYRSVCQKIQRTISICTQLSSIDNFLPLTKNSRFEKLGTPSYDNGFIEDCVYASEIGVLCLTDIWKERKMLVQSTDGGRSFQQSRAKAVQQSTTFLSSSSSQSSTSSLSKTTEPSSTNNDDSSTQFFSDWFTKVFNRFKNPIEEMNQLKSPIKEEKVEERVVKEQSRRREDSEINDGYSLRMAHEDPNLHVTPFLLHKVVVSLQSLESFQSESNILMTTASYSSPYYTENDSTSKVEHGYAKERRERCFEIASRMKTLLENVPSSVNVYLESQNIVLETLSRCGRIESARQGNEFFQSCQRNQKTLLSNKDQSLPFVHLVLQGYLEAAKYEANQDMLLVLLEEAERVYYEYDKNRIMNGSILLHIIAVVGLRLGGFPGMGHKCATVAEHILGSETYWQLHAHLRSKSPRIETESLPVINFLSQIYALSDAFEDVETGKRMLLYMMNLHKGIGTNCDYPDVHTFNYVLDALIRRYGTKSKDIEQNLDTKQRTTDMNYAMSLIDYMLERPNGASWPDDSTYALLFRLGRELEPLYTGQFLSTLLVRMELGKVRSGENAPVALRLSMYHRALNYFLETVKSRRNSDNDEDIEICIDCCERAVLLLQGLESRSTPVFFNVDYIRHVPEARNVYDTSVRPTRTTYELVLMIITEAATFRKSTNGTTTTITDSTDDQKTTIIQERLIASALDVYKQMLARGFPAPRSSKQLLKCCTSLKNNIPKESSYSKAPEELEKLLLTLSTEDDTVSSIASIPTTVTTTTATTTTQRVPATP